MADVKLTADEREVMWSDFLKRWPLEGLGSIALTDYTQAGNKDVFQNWLEIQTEALGSIWGGSAFKFGIYSRDSKADKENGRGKSYAADYAWYTKYGDTPEAAWQKVRSIIAAIAKAAREGDWQAIEQADLGTVVKWKIAFLYQNRESSSILPMYSPERLQWLSGQSSKLSPIALQQTLMAQRGAQGLFAYVDGLQQRWDAHAASLLTPEQALEWLKGQEVLSLIKEPTSKIAGFQDEEGRELALALDNKRPSLFMSDGEWLSPAVRAQLSQLQIKLTFYKEDESRSSNLEANAPSLWVGHRAVRLNDINTLSCLETVLNHYLVDGGTVMTPALQGVKQEPMKGLVSMGEIPLNQILFGPPGTGKTYATVTKALEILDPELWATCGQGKQEREKLKASFDELCKQGRIRFATFHQSFGYEDFVEGIRADAVSDGEAEGVQALSYRIEPGVFKRLCEDAQRDPVAEAGVGISANAKVWKLSIEEANSDGKTRAYCLAHGEARVGWSNVGDLQSEAFEKDTSLGVKEKSSLRNFGFGIQPGDVVVVLKTVKTIQSVGVVTGSYKYEPVVAEGVRKDYVHKLPVHWLATGLDFDVTALNSDTQLTLQTVYRLWNMSWPKLQQALLDAKVQLKGLPAPSARKALPYVLVIDEINRGNVSRIFGELITLLEPSKREGAAEALSVTLPYSKTRFSVPGNVYIIGTMNTTDRSLAGLDVALRRRFEFEELMPAPEVLSDVTVTEGAVSVNIAQLLRVMNERIEALLDREHQLGHAYFMELREDASLARLAQVFKNRVIPLLQEYFFDDWERIAWVLNDHRKPEAQRFVTKHGRSLEALFGSNHGVQAVDKRWCINKDAFKALGSFKAVIEVDGSSAANQPEQPEAAQAGSSN